MQPFVNIAQAPVPVNSQMKEDDERAVNKAITVPKCSTYANFVTPALQSGAARQAAILALGAWSNGTTHGYAKLCMHGVSCKHASEQQPDYCLDSEPKAGMGSYLARPGSMIGAVQQMCQSWSTPCPQEHEYSLPNGVTQRQYHRL